MLLVEQLLEKALAAADRVYALVQGHIALEAPTGGSDLPKRLERAYFGHESHALRGFGCVEMSDSDIRRSACSSLRGA